MNSNPQPHIPRPTALKGSLYLAFWIPLHSILENESPLVQAVRDKSNQDLVSDLAQALSNRDQLGRWCLFETLCTCVNGVRHRQPESRSSVEQKLLRSEPTLARSNDTTFTLQDCNSVTTTQAKRPFSACIIAILTFSLLR